MAGTVALATLGLAAPASASHHDVKVAEIYPGSVAAPSTEYVELEMASAGQRFFAGTDATVTLFDADGGTPTHTEALNATLDNGERGRRVLISVNSIETTFPGIGTDFLFNPGDFLSGAGGAACFKPDDTFVPTFVDCVSWGNYSGTTPSATGGNVSPTGIADGQAIRRERVECEIDLVDTNAPADWSEAAPDPQSNSSPAATGGCPETTIKKSPRKRTTDRTPRIRFEADPAEGATFECRVDGDPFEDCESPYTSDRLKLGRHTFRVKAIGPDGVDPTPAKATFKVVRP